MEDRSKSGSSSEGTEYVFVRDFRRQKEQFRLTRTGLVYEGSQGKREIPFSEIREIRLRYHPGRINVNNYETDIRLQNGKLPGIRNVSWQGFGDFTPHDEAYRTFVRNLVAGVQQSGQDIPIRTGTTRFRYYSGIATMLLLFFVMLSMLLNVEFSFTGGAAVKFAIILIYFPVLYPYYKKNRPGTITGPVPEKLLPS